MVSTSLVPTPGIATVTSPAYRSLSVCLHDLQALPLGVRPDSVKIFFGDTPAYTIHVDEGCEIPNPQFRSTPKTLAKDLTVHFEYLIYPDEPDESETEAKLLSQVVFQRDDSGKVVADKLLDIFSYSDTGTS